MDKENAKQHRNETPSVVEDLTLNEAEADNVKGGAVDMFLKITDVKGESKDRK